MTTIKIIPDQCNAVLTVLTSLGGLELPPKICVKPKGHDGVHSDGNCIWLNAAKLGEDISRRFDKPKPRT